MGVFRPVSAIAAAALLAATLTAVTPGSAGAGFATTSADPSHPLVRAAPAAARSAQAVRRYWTADRMRAAVPIEDVVSGLTETFGPGRTAVRDRGSHRAAPQHVRTPRTTGKLFFTDGALDYVCSASAILTRRRNQAITAGHCVHSGPNVLFPHYYSNWVFVPRYRDGRAPFGKWVAKNAWAFNGWVEGEAFRYDQAILAFQRRGGQRLVDVVGGNEVVWGKRQREWGVRIWGWPAEAPYDGETSRHCDGRTVRFRHTADAAMRQCSMNGGASGGPWFLPRGRTVNTGRIWAITSRRLEDQPVLLARPIPPEIRRMIRGANR